MSTATDILPLEETKSPSEQAEVAEIVRAAGAAGQAIYPIGGGTALDYGVAAKRPGWGLSLAGLDRVVDYPARDMTITVEAGITMARLAEVLSAERQRLPIDVPQASEATLGGVVATNFNGPRRYGQGTVRDYVIGISAVDGRGTPFKGGGRVVKNVAGYDFCKLLTGSLGTLAVITQVTLKIKPIPEATAFVACDVADLNEAESRLAALVHTATSPVAIELLAGPAWYDDPALGPQADGSVARLVVGVEGSAAEVEWMLTQLALEWRQAGVHELRRIDEPNAVAGLWQRLAEFPAQGQWPLVLKANVLPGATTSLVAELLAADAECSLQAHAGNGIVIARLPQMSAEGISPVLIRRLQPAAREASGNVVVLRGELAAELPRQAIWGAVPDDIAMMRSAKNQFDPQGLLNPGRFVYGTQ